MIWFLLLLMVKHSSIIRSTFCASINANAQQSPGHIYMYCSTVCFAISNVAVGTHEHCLTCDSSAFSNTRFIMR